MPDIIINGPAGRLEARYSHSKLPNAPLAIVMHPHPLMGGTMNNKVTFAMYQAFAQRGFSVIRFNFRGVGASQGTFDKGEGELSDAAAALDWMQAINPNAPFVWTAGFSFGAWVSMQLLMRRPEIKGYITVAPPANEFDFTFLAPCPQSGLIIHGGKDNLVPRTHVDQMVERLRAQKGISVDYRCVEDSNHFFTHHADNVVTHMHDYLDQRNVGQYQPVTQQKAG